MAEYLIQSETLDDIADAINAKTGGSSAMTPAEMVTAIGSISGGEGAKWKLIADYTTNENVQAIRIDFTDEMKSYDYFRFEVTAAGTPNVYPCPQINTTNSQKYIGSYTSGLLKTYSGVITRFSNFGDVYCICCCYNTSNAAPIQSGDIQYFYFRQYYEASVWKAGANVKIYGVKIT